MRKLLASIVLSGIVVSPFMSAYALGNSDSSCQGLESCHVTVTDAKVKYTTGTSTEIKMDIKNRGNKTVDIVAAYSPLDEQTQLHHYVLNTDGQRVMKPIRSIEVYPHNTVDLSYQEVHVMLMKLNAKLKKGEVVPVTLILHDGSSVQVNAKVS